MSKYELNQDYSMEIGGVRCQVKLIEIQTYSHFPPDYHFQYLPGSPTPLFNEALKELNLKGDFNLPAAFIDVIGISKLNPGPEEAEAEESEYNARLERYLEKEFSGKEEEARRLFMKLPEEHVIREYLTPNNF